MTEPPEMAQVSHHNLSLHNHAYAQRNPSTSTTSPLSPVDTLTPFLYGGAPELVSAPGRAYFTPGRGSLVSETSQVLSSPSSRSSLSSEKRNQPGLPTGNSQHQKHGSNSNRQSRSSGHRSSHRTGRDLEQGRGSKSSPAAHSGRGLISDHMAAHKEGYDLREDQQELESRAVSLLLFLSFPVALVSVLIAGWTVVCLVVFLFAQPLRLLHARPSPRSELVSLVSPSLRLQLRLIHSSAASKQYSAGMLVVIHLISPFVAMGVAFAAWVAGCFWFFSAILGDPAGDDCHNDGKASVVGVRNWWKAWLCRGLR